MKSLPVLFTMAALSCTAFAEQEFPRNTFEVKDLEKAKAEAVASKKPITYLYTDKASTCSLCQGATDAFMDVAKSKTIVVYVSSKDQSSWQAVPEVARPALSAGKYIPSVAVVTADGSKLITSINYDTYKADEKSVRDFKKALAAAK